MGLRDRQGSRGGDCGRGNAWIRGRRDELGADEGGEQVNGFLAGEFEGRRAEVEKVVCRDRGRCDSLTSHLVELAPKKLLLREYIHGKGVLPLG